MVQLAPRYRVILCPQGLQWIIQEKEASRSGHWRAKSYHTSRDSLLSASGRLGLLSDPKLEQLLAVLPTTARECAEQHAQK